MHPNPPFLEIDHESTAAPCRWAFGPREAVPVRFGLLLSVPAVAAGLSVVASTDPAGQEPRVIAAAQAAGPPAGGDGGYRYFHAEIPPLGREGGLSYRPGYQSTDGTWHWMADWRHVIVTSAPRRSADIVRRCLGRVDGVPVYGPPPAGAVTASPADWRGRLFYSILIDRFARGGAPGRGAGFVAHRPVDPRGSHGGTIAGIERRLDYLADLGAGALILSPVYVNDAAGYHGYHPLHLLAVDPRLGTMDDLRSLVAAAHARGIAVLIDVIVNHLADCLDWQATGEGVQGRFKFDAGDLGSPLPYPEDLCHPGFFHPPGSDDDLVGAPLFGFLADWRTEHGYVRDHLIRHLQYWIAQTDIDGFRFDAVRHVDLAFWQHCVREIDRYCRAIGKPAFLMLGEHAGHTAAEVGPYSRGAAFTGMIDYPLHYCLKEVVETGGSAAIVSRYLERECFAYRDSRWNLAFVDNQDTSRFLHDWGRRFGGLPQARQALRAALALIVLGPGMPCIYYGTEQEFSGALGRHVLDDGQDVGHDAYVREDMYPNPGCAWMFGPINTPLHAPYDRSNPTFAAIRELSRLRADLPAVNAGDRHSLIGGDPAVIAWMMWCGEGDGDLVVVAVNLSPDGPLRHRIACADLPAGMPEEAVRRLCATTAWSALIADRSHCSVPAPGVIELALGAYGILLLRPGAA